MLTEQEFQLFAPQFIYLKLLSQSGCAGAFREAIASFTSVSSIC